MVIFIEKSAYYTQVNTVNQDNNFCAISLNILITYLPDYVWILLREVTCLTHLGDRGLNQKYTSQSNRYGL